MDNNRYISRKSKARDPDQLVRQVIWAYFFLVIFEGALRKWVLPGLSTPLLLVRDPLALWVVYKVWNTGKFPRSLYVIFTVILTVVGIVTAMIFGHGSLLVALFGARIYLIHFLFMFAMGKVFDRDEVIKVGKLMLWISIPMVILIAMQFYSPQSALVNRGVGGDMAGSGFSGALGFFRPSATFSFTNGTTLFFGLVSAFVIYFWLNPQNVNRILLIAASASLLMAIPLSISRTYLFTLVITIVFAVFAASRNPKYLGKIITTAIILVFAIFLLSQLSFIQTSIEAMTSRFDNASASEGGLGGTLGERYLGGFIKPFIEAVAGPFFGYGMGMGTSVGSQLLTGKISYLISEGEWGRVLGEMGMLMGTGMILIRLGISFKFLTSAYKRLVAGDVLPWMLLAYALLLIPQGQWSQPTALGFSTVVGGLLFASMRKTEPVTDTNLKLS